eukprot:6680202-Ditylum_brightwellii.AAC.1
MIFNGQQTVKQTISWLHDFQLQVDEVVGGSCFQVTAEVWKPLEVSEEPTKSTGEGKENYMLEEGWKMWEEKVK